MGIVTSSNFGAALTLAASATFAFASTVLRRLAPKDIDLGHLMGVTGLIVICLSPCLLLSADHLGVEPFGMPSRDIFEALTLNALLGCTLPNYLYTCALLMLSPLVATVTLSLSIPVSAIVDAI